MAWSTYTKSTTTKHKLDCKMAFGRKDVSCPRCQELLNGAAPVEWTVSANKRAEKRQIASIRNHNCITSKCGPVCTHGEW